MQQDGPTELAAKLPVVGELLELIVEVSVRAGGRVVFGEDERQGVGGSAARPGNLDLDLIHRGAMVSEEEGFTWFLRNCANCGSIFAVACR